MVKVNELSNKNLYSLTGRFCLMLSEIVGYDCSQEQHLHAAELVMPEASTWGWAYPFNHSIFVENPFFFFLYSQKDTWSYEGLYTHHYFLYPKQKMDQIHVQIPEP